MALCTHIHEELTLADEPLSDKAKHDTSACVTLGGRIKCPHYQLMHTLTSKRTLKTDSMKFRKLQQVYMYSYHIYVCVHYMHTYMYIFMYVYMYMYMSCTCIYAHLTTSECLSKTDTVFTQTIRDSNYS